MNLLELAVKVVMDDSEVDKGFDDVEEKASSFSDKMNRVGKGLATAGAIGAGVAVATAKLGKSFVDNASDVAAYGDNIDKMSQKMGISAQAYQEWDAIMQHSGTSIEALKPSMKTLANAAEKGSDAFQKLGISEQEVASLSQEDLFAKVISGLQGMEEGTERTYITSQLLGRGATELGALLNTSAEETEAMRKRVHELGGVMSDEAVKSAAAFQDQLQDMQTGIQSLSRNILSEFLPSLTAVMGGLTDIFTGNYDEGIEKISSALSSIVDGLAERLPNMLEVGLKIIENLAQAILQNIPVILPAMVDIVLEIAQAIIENLPTIIEVGMEIMIALAEGLADAIPDLIPAIILAITTIVDKLTDPDTMMKLIEASLMIMVALAEGLVKAIPQLIEKVPQIIQNLVTTIERALPKIVEAGLKILEAIIGGILKGIPKIPLAVAQIKDSITEGVLNIVNSATTWGRDLIQNFINGIREKFADFKEELANMAQTVKDYIGFSEPDIGPLSNFHTFAPDMMELFAEGIKDNTRLVTDQIKKSFDFGSDIVQGRSVNTLTTINETSIPKANESINVNVTIEPIPGFGAEMLRVVKKEARKQYESTGINAVVYGG